MKVHAISMDFQILLWIFKFFSSDHCMLPTCFDELFTTKNQIHGYNTKSAGNYRPHTCRTNINIWNSLPIYN
jgi:hypothetical protein